jgi:catechol 2,3-dioxygenase
MPQGVWLSSFDLENFVCSNLIKTGKNPGFYLLRGGLMNTLPVGHLKMGAVSLTVSDLNHSIDFYQKHIGLRLQERSNGTAILGAGNTPLVKLQQLPHALRTRGVTGLYHFALLLPSRLELAKNLTHFINLQTPITGVADHIVSEAIYLNDPDGHGIEIYRDRPRQKWYDQEGKLLTDTKQLDIEGLLGELDGNKTPFDGLPDSTVMGHMHLHVSNIPDAENFYLGIIGLNKPPSTINLPSASFLSVGGYHHHLAVNTWAGVGAPPPPQEAACLLNYEILFPNQESLNTVLQRLEASYIEAQHTDLGWLVRDPSQNAILLRPD